jgi:hypothetical protein
VSSLQIVTKDSDLDSENKSVTVLCDESGSSDLTAIAGGGLVTLANGTVASGVAIAGSRPTGLAGETPGGWVANATEVGDNAASWKLTAYAVCAIVH